MESLGLSQKDVQSRNKHLEKELSGQPANPGSPGKNGVCACVCVCVCSDTVGWVTGRASGL